MKNLWLKRIIKIMLLLFTLGFVSTLAFFICVASGFFLKSGSTTLSEEVVSGTDAKDKIGILRLEGIILSSGSDGAFTSGGVINSGQVKRWFREMVKDSSLKAVILEVNSPGGSPVASDEIYSAIRNLRQSGRAVVVVMEDTAASGAYFFSVAADKIIANPATLTGSIGVIAEIPNIEKLLANLGVNMEIYKSGKFKDSTSYYRGRSPEEQAMIQDYVNNAYELFVSRVVEGRGMDTKLVKELAQGQMYSGSKAKQLGLIDELGSVEDAVQISKALQGLQEVKIVRYRTESPLDVLLGKVGSAINPLAGLLMRLTSPGFQAAYLPQ